MKTADIPSLIVLRAFADRRINGLMVDDALAVIFPSAPEKVIWRAMEREEMRGHVDCGVSLRGGWLTEKGIAMLESLTAKERETA